MEDTILQENANIANGTDVSYHDKLRISVLQCESLRELADKHMQDLELLREFAEAERVCFNTAISFGKNTTADIEETDESDIKRDAQVCDNVILGFKYLPSNFNMNRYFYRLAAMNRQRQEINFQIGKVILWKVFTNIDRLLSRWTKGFYKRHREQSLLFISDECVNSPIFL